MGAGKVSLRSLFSLALTVLLVGYAYLGKGFAYLHVPVGFPLYVGEMVLLLGLAWALLTPNFPLGLVRTWPGAIFLCFAAWGVIRTVPYFGQYGLDAARDAALYYYGAFMFLGYALVREREALTRFAGLYAKGGRWYIYWVPVAFLLYALAREAIPDTPGTGGVPLFIFKAGDIVVHLAGAVAFFLLAAEHVPGLERARRAVAWYATAVVAALLTLSRGAYLALACSGLAALFLGAPRKTLYRVALAGAMVLALLLIIDPQISIRAERKISLQTIVGLAQSIVTATPDVQGDVGQDSRKWRLLWWGKIANETFFGEYFWLGRGFGENLADAHGFQTGSKMDPRPLRSPHNAHMTVLSRMGVPGIVLWGALLGSLLWHFYRAWKRARRAGDRFLQGILAWVICYGMAAVVDAAFDVYLESPQGAIWFWIVMGVGLAAARLEPASAAEEVRP